MPVSVLIGTTKGAFILSSTNGRDDWALSGPHCDGWPINHVIGDPNSGMIWAAGGNGWHGAGVWCSTNGGQTWSLSKFSNGDMDEWIRKDAEMAAIESAAPGATDLKPYVGVQFAAIPEFPEVGGVVAQEMAAALSGAKSVDEALKASQAAADAIMKEAGYY